MGQRCIVLNNKAYAADAIEGLTKALKKIDQRIAAGMVNNGDINDDIGLCFNASLDQSQSVKRGE